MTRLGRSFGKLFAASTVSNIGDGIMIAALPLLMAELTRNPLAVAGSTIAGTLPWFLFALIAGAVADRINRRTAMVVADVVRGVVVAALAVSVATGNIGLITVYLAAFAIGSAETLFDSAAEALVPHLVDEPSLGIANGRLQGIEWTANSFAGPPIGAFLFGIAAALPFFANAVSFFAAAALIALIPRRFGAGGDVSGMSMRRSIAEGLRFLFESRVLRTLAVMAGLTNVFILAVVATFVLFAQDELGVTDTEYGFLLSALGVGGLTGALLAPRVQALLGPGTTIQLAVVGQTVLILLFGLNSNKYLAGLILLLWGTLVTTWNVVGTTLRQNLTPDRLRARVSSASRLIAWGAQPFGALLGGVLAAAFGLRAPFFVAGATWAVMFAVTAPIVNNRTIAAARAQVTEAASDAG